MQYSKVFKINFYCKPINFILKNRLILILVLVFISGFSFAVFSSGKSEIVNDWTRNYLTKYIFEKQNYSFLKYVFSNFLSSNLFLVLCLISGTSMFGVVTVPLVIVFKGYFNGCIASYLYSVYSFEGVAFHTVIILPSAIILSVVLIICSAESINFSISLAKLTFYRDYTNKIFIGFKKLILKYIVYTIFVFISALIDSLLSLSFLKSFSGII